MEEQSNGLVTYHDHSKFKRDAKLAEIPHEAVCVVVNRA